MITDPLAARPPFSYMNFSLFHRRTNSIPQLWVHGARLNTKKVGHPQTVYSLILGVA